ncbi:hypothetical protein G6514_006473 [Epicoccum nigrum]|nr:hypothetical protein G6514_006473 [Epicoccum nigrum]
MYSQSTDPDGSRKEIAMLTSVQSQHLANWLNFEDRQMQKPLNPYKPQPGRRTGSLLAKSLERKSGSSTMVEADLRRRRQDDKMRQLFSADAEHWQDGSRLSVADSIFGRFKRRLDKDAWMAFIDILKTVARYDSKRRWLTPLPLPLPLPQLSSEESTREKPERKRQ